MEDITIDEQLIIKQYIFLPLVKKVLENDRKAIEASRIKFKEIYLDLIDHALSIVSDDLRQAKRSIIRQNIKPIKQGNLSYEVVVKGYRHPLTFHPNIAAEKVKALLQEYMKKPFEH